MSNIDKILVSAHINMDELPSNYSAIYTSGLFGKIKDNTMVDKNNLLNAIRKKIL